MNHRYPTAVIIHYDDASPATSEEQERHSWQVWYRSYTNRWVASLTTADEHPGGMVYFGTHQEAVDFAARKNAELHASPTTITPAANLAAELSAIAHRLDYVLTHGGGKLDTCELHELSCALQQTDELVVALRGETDIRL